MNSPPLPADIQALLENRSGADRRQTDRRRGGSSSSLLNLFRAGLERDRRKQDRREGHRRENDVRASVGESPGMGEFTCEGCGGTVRLLNNGDKLPSCLVCGVEKTVSYVRVDVGC